MTVLGVASLRPAFLYNGFDAVICNESEKEMFLSDGGTLPITGPPCGPRERVVPSVTTLAKGLTYWITADFLSE